jgi:hypothetical protein
MRSEYRLKGGRPNPYAARLGKSGRADLVSWWTSVTVGMRVLPSRRTRDSAATDLDVQRLSAGAGRARSRMTDRRSERRVTDETLLSGENGPSGPSCVLCELAHQVLNESGYATRVYANR